MTPSIITIAVFVFLFWFAIRVMKEVRIRQQIRDRLDKQHASQIALQSIAYIGSVRIALGEARDMLQNQSYADRLVLINKINDLLDKKHTTGE